MGPVSIGLRPSALREAAHPNGRPLVSTRSGPKSLDRPPHWWDGLAYPGQSWKPIIVSARRLAPPLGEGAPDGRFRGLDTSGGWHNGGPSRGRGQHRRSGSGGGNWIHVLSSR
jgi:hypothetical protein